MRTKQRDSRLRAHLPHLAQTVARTTACALLLLACIFSLAASGFARTESFSQIYPLPAGGSFVLENVNGSVQVEGWARDEVQVEAVKTSASDAQDLEHVMIEVESQPGKVSVHTRYPKGDGGEVAVEYHVHVPYRVLLGSVGTVNGSVLVRGVEGGGALKSVNGNVEVLNSSGRFSAKTTNGDLRLELRKLLDEGGPMNIETVNGSVVLGLPSDARANLNVSSMNGDFTSDLPVTSTASIPAARAYRAKLGAGGGEISVRTVNGGIRLVMQRPGGV
jgi:putative adhesin